MSFIVAIAMTSAFCRPADLLCSYHLGFEAVTAAEVPDFLPITAACWSHGPCPSRRITSDQVEGYIRSISPSTIRVPASLARQLRRRVEDYHYRCNQEIKAEFARAFSAGDFTPQVRDDYRKAVIAFFASREGQELTIARSELNVSEAAAPYGDARDRLNLAPATAKRLSRFMASGPGRWWAAARATAWRRVMGGADMPQPQQLCSTATEEFEDARIGAIVQAGLTEPIVYRDPVRRSPAQ